MSVRPAGPDGSNEPPAPACPGDAHQHSVDWFGLSESNLPHTRSSAPLAAAPPTAPAGPASAAGEVSLWRALRDAVACVRGGAPEACPASPSAAAQRGQAGGRSAQGGVPD